MVSKLAVGIIVAIVVVAAGGTAAYLLTRPSEATETYELSCDYQVGEYYVYETATTTTMDNEPAGTVVSSYSMEVVAVEGNEITVEVTENLEGADGSQYGVYLGSAEATVSMTMTNKGDIVSWEITNVEPPEYWENVEVYENYTIPYSEIFSYSFPEEAIPIGHEWEAPIEAEIPWGPFTMPLTGEVSVCFVREENITVEAGTFECWRIDHVINVSGELSEEDFTATTEMTIEGTNWLYKQNCAQIKSTMSFTYSYESGEYSQSSVSESVSELVEYGTV